MIKFRKVVTAAEEMDKDRAGIVKKEEKMRNLQLIMADLRKFI